MAIGTRRIKRFREDRDSKETQNHAKSERLLTPEEEQELAYQEYKRAQKQFEEIVYKNRNKSSVRDEIKPALNDLKKSAGKLADDFFEGTGRISRSVERDIRRHSVQGQIDNAIIDSLMAKNKGSRTTKSHKPEVFVKIYDKSGHPIMIREKDLPRRTTTRRR